MILFLSFASASQFGWKIEESVAGWLETWTTLGEGSLVGWPHRKWSTSAVLCGTDKMIWCLPRSQVILILCNRNGWKGNPIRSHVRLRKELKSTDTPLFSLNHFPTLLCEAREELRARQIIYGRSHLSWNISSQIGSKSVWCPATPKTLARRIVPTHYHTIPMQSTLLTYGADFGSPSCPVIWFILRVVHQDNFSRSDTLYSSLRVSIFREDERERWIITSSNISAP